MPHPAEVARARLQRAEEVPAELATLLRTEAQVFAMLAIASALEEIASSIDNTSKMLHSVEILER